MAYERECEMGCEFGDDHEGECLTAEDIAEEKLRARDYEAWAAL